MSPRRVLVLGGLGLVGIAVILALSGESDQRRRFELALPGGENFDPISVDLRDATGLIEAISIAEVNALGEDELAGVVWSVPGRPRSIQFAWLGGACDDRQDLQFERAAAGYLLSTHVDRGLGLGCSGLGVIRGIELRLSIDIDPRHVAIEQR